MFRPFNKLISLGFPKPCISMQFKKCHSVFGLKDLILQKQLNKFTLKQVNSEDHSLAVDIIKNHYLTEHVLVKSRQMNINNDCALDEYLINILKQGNSIFTMTDHGAIAGLCVNYASCPVDPRNLRNYAFYRQDPNTKDFLYFTAKLQETPNLWDIYKQLKVFEIQMITVLPEFRRQGLAVLMAEKSIAQAYDQGYKIIRMDCINPYDYKIAERCMLQCLVKFPLHKLRSATSPFIKRNSEHNRCVRVYIATRDYDIIRDKQINGDFENLIE